MNRTMNISLLYSPRPRVRVGSIGRSVAQRPQYEGEGAKESFVRCQYQIPGRRIEGTLTKRSGGRILGFESLVFVTSCRDGLF